MEDEKITKDDVNKAYIKIQKKIHPDLNKNQNTEYLSKIVNNAKDTILKLSLIHI